MPNTIYTYCIKEGNTLGVFATHQPMPMKMTLKEYNGTNLTMQQIDAFKETIQGTEGTLEYRRSVNNSIMRCLERTALGLVNGSFTNSSSLALNDTQAIQLDSSDEFTIERLRAISQDITDKAIEHIFDFRDINLGESNNNFSPYHTDKIKILAPYHALFGENTSVDYVRFSADKSVAKEGNSLMESKSVPGNIFFKMIELIYAEEEYAIKIVNMSSKMLVVEKKETTKIIKKLKDDWQQKILDRQQSLKVDKLHVEELDNHAKEVKIAGTSSNAILPDDNVDRITGLKRSFSDSKPSHLEKSGKWTNLDDDQPVMIGGDKTNSVREFRELDEEDIDSDNEPTDKKVRANRASVKYKSERPVQSSMIDANTTNAFTSAENTPKQTGQALKASRFGCFGSCGSKKSAKETAKETADKSITASKETKTTENSSRSGIGWWSQKKTIIPESNSAAGQAKGYAAPPESSSTTRKP